MSDARVGVTGHRRLGGQEREVAAEVASVLDAVVDRVRRPDGVVPLLIVTALAEGADRIVAREGLARGAALDVILPLEVDDYETDFADDASRREFDNLLARAAMVEIVEPQPTRDDAYHEAGVRMIERSDLLIAVWDGEAAAGRGGTAEMVELARTHDRPLAWIRVDQETDADASPPSLTRERWPWPS